MKERTIEDYIAYEEEVNEYGKSCVEKAFDLPVDYFEDKNLLVDTDLIVDPEDFVENRIRETERKDIERIVINKVIPKDALVCGLYFGLFDGKKRSLKECGEILKMDTERVKFVLSMAIQTLRHPNLINAIDTGLSQKAISKIKFKNYGEFLADCAEKETDLVVKENIEKIYSGYVAYRKSSSSLEK